MRKQRPKVEHLKVAQEKSSGLQPLVGYGLNNQRFVPVNWLFPKPFQ